MTKLPENYAKAIGEAGRDSLLPVFIMLLLGMMTGIGGGIAVLGALLAASLPFIVEGRFGILGTSFNPDMSQHLLATA